MIKTIEKMYTPMVNIKDIKGVKRKNRPIMYIIMDIIQCKAVTTKSPFKTLFIQYFCINFIVLE